MTSANLLRKMIAAVSSSFWFVRANRGSDCQSDFLRLQRVQYTARPLSLWGTLKCGGFFYRLTE